MKLIKRIAFGSAGLLVLLMMAATVVEKLQGTGTAWTAIYGSPFFTILWGILAVCALVYLISRKLQRDFFTFLLHIAFLVILAGALTNAPLRKARKHPFADERYACFGFRHFGNGGRAASFRCAAARFPHRLLQRKLCAHGLYQPHPN